MGRREKREKKKKGFNSYNLIVIICLIVIVGSLYIVLNKNEKVAGDLKNTINEATTWTKGTFGNIFSSEGETKTEKQDQNKQVQKEKDYTQENKTKEQNTNNIKAEVTDETVINVTQAKEMAIQEFVKLGEEGIKIDNLTVRGILRDNERYYEVSSQKNKLEIKISTGKITRVNDKETK